ncbi:hypothetical protein [Alteromonas sp. KUL49]|uniref:hypothetical protein n=1 Tax=Alteromonas sp. KUL49 TaxID=2480798 RepID=UPI00102F1D45|nr:hypothetical protein [Alteromonas sp. KUL49]TAP39705.1 hypothetical protein EYS00_10265 [Alteromonas sp. KUL49]GEA11695.1 hypothetical protein KUL49_20700 [Alteromonas sp. KUL49]
MDTHLNSIMNDPRYMGTYNNINPATKPHMLDFLGWYVYAAKGIGHIAVDVVPNLIGSNVRRKH